MTSSPELFHLISNQLDVLNVKVLIIVSVQNAVWESLVELQNSRGLASCKF